MSKRTPQTFEKRQRERRKQMKRQAKLERRQLRNEDKKRVQEGLPAVHEPEVVEAPQEDRRDQFERVRDEAAQGGDRT